MKKILCWSVCLLPLCLAGGCSVETNPEIPTWDTQLNIPLGTERTTLDEWINESDDVLFETESGLIGFYFEGTLERTEIGDRLNVKEVEETFADSIGDFELSPPTPKSAEFKFSDLWGDAGTFDQITMRVPSFDFQDQESEVPHFPSFESMSLAEGTLRARVTNPLPVPIENLTLEIVDRATSTPILTLPSVTIPEEEADSTASDLAGITLTDTLLVRASGSSPGSTDSVLVIAGALVGIEVVLEDLVATQASAELPATEIQFEETAQIPEGMEVTQAAIDSGRVNLLLTTDLPVNLSGSLTVAEILTAKKVPLTIDVHIPAGGQSDYTIPLDGHTLSLPTPGDGEPQVLNVSATVTTEETGEIVTVEAADGMTVEFTTSPLYFSTVAGILDSTDFEIDSTSVEVDFPEDVENIQLQEAQLRLDVISSIPVPVSVSFLASGDQGVDLPLGFELVPVPGGLVDTTIVFENGDIVDFLNSLPRMVSVSGQGWAGDGVTEATVSRTDSILGAYRFEVPFHLSITKNDTVDTDIQDTEISPENDEIEDVEEDQVDGDLTRRVKSAELWATFRNHTPFGIVVTANFATDSLRVFSNPNLSLEPVEVDPGVTDAEGNVSDVTVVEHHQLLTDEDLEIFRNTGTGTKFLYFGGRLEMLATEGAVKAHASDYFETEARLRVELLADLPEEF